MTDLYATPTHAPIHGSVPIKRCTSNTNEFYSTKPLRTPVVNLQSKLWKMSGIKCQYAVKCTVRDDWTKHVFSKRHS